MEKQNIILLLIELIFMNMAQICGQVGILKLKLTMRLTQPTVLDRMDTHTKPRNPTEPTLPIGGHSQGEKREEEGTRIRVSCLSSLTQQPDEALHHPGAE